MTFLAGQKMFDCAQKQVDALKADGCDVVVCLGHLGIDEESKGNRSIDLLEKVKGIDVFIDGHSHSTLDEVKKAAEGHDLNGAVLTSTGTKLASVGVVTIDAQKKISVENVALESLTGSVEAVADRAAAIQKEIDDDYGTVFAKTAVELNGVKAQVRTGEDEHDHQSRTLWSGAPRRTVSR